MEIELFEHNRIAYESAVAMLAETGKAAVIHPTGTGKSFIGFKLCEDNPDKRICWLSPSEYIFKTQLENLRAAAKGWQPKNVVFLTYAKLSQMTDDEIAAVDPAFLVLDEFHRCGATVWQQGVERILKKYPDSPILGLSATNIRYLDNQRNMAEELFDGNIASEMTLGEAIVRGILKSPRYVLSVFSYQDDYERLRSRVRRTRNKAVRNEAEQYLEALRRALERADGLDVIFDKHMEERTGKYLVFCSSLEHMREMQSKARDFFGRIDKAPHIYTAYSNDAATDKAFAAFKADDSEHLKLLYCIDMLNEGVHVDDVSGVILFRPTISPIIYKQQIGRALSVSGSGTPVIFDIVNNIDNLYAIDTVQQEMREAIHFWQGAEPESIDNFRVFDEVRDARELFERLNDKLSASWDVMYEYARRYSAENGNLEVPSRYKTPEGYSLGNWISTQRKVYAGLQYGSLSAERIAKLEAIGMIWGSYRALSWNRYYEEAKLYFEKHDDLSVPATYITENGVRLGAWIANQRAAKRDANGISEERIKKLDAIGMVWSVNDQLWEQCFAACERYFQEHGDLNIPVKYCTTDGLQLGSWLSRQRDLRKGKIKGAPLTDEQIDRLDAIGMVWESKVEQAWNRGLEEAESYYASHGDLVVPTAYVSPDGFCLGRWISERRTKGKNKHSLEQQKQLDALGMIWERPDSWEVRYGMAADYFRQYGNLNIPNSYKVGGIWLYKWLNEQRQIRIGNRPGKTLSKEQIAKLDAIGMDWENRNHVKWNAAWEEQYREAASFFNENGHLAVPDSYRTASGKKLAIWVRNQRKRRNEGKLPEEQIRLLDAIGMIWEFDDSWETGFRHAEVYFKSFGDLDVNWKYISPDGYELGSWIANQRRNYKNAERYGAFSEEKISRLDAIGMQWSPAETQWRNGYEHARAYIRSLNGEKWKQLYVSSDGFKTGQWIRGQLRKAHESGLSADRRKMLEEIGLLDPKQSISPVAPAHTTVLATSQAI